LRQAKRYGKRERRSTLASSELTEKEFQASVISLAKLHGWKVYHTFDSRKSEKGFPDLILLRGLKLLAIECKTTTGKVTEEQANWLIAFSHVERVEAMVLRPAEDLDAIELVLR